MPRVIDGLPEIILRLQRELFVVGAPSWPRPPEPPIGPTRRDARQRRDGRGPGRAAGADRGPRTLPREFVVPGETRLSAVLELARTVVRRAERRAVTVRRAEPVADDQLVPYLNRLADLLWVLARAAEQAEARAATPSREPGKRSGPDKAGRQA